MDEIERLALLIADLVRGVEPREDVRHDRRHDLERDALDVAGDETHEARERLAVDVVHDDEDLARVRDDVEGRDDVRMADARSEARLVEEHRGELRVHREVLVESLHRDRAREADLARQSSEVHRRHSSGGDLCIERVTPEFLHRSLL